MVVIIDPGGHPAFHVSLLPGMMRFVKVFLQEITHQLLMPVHFSFSRV